MSRKPIVQVPSEAQAREKLALYVYEYLYHLGAQKTAQIFLNEIGWQKSVEISDSPGFLTSWWSVFWDLYCAAPDRRDACDFNSEAKAFHDSGMHGAPTMMMMVGGEMFGPSGPLDFAGPMGVGPAGVHMGVASGAHMMPFPGGPHGARIGSANAQMSFYGTPGTYPPNLPPPNGLRMVGGASFVPNGFEQQHQQLAGAPSGYCGMTSPHHNMQLGGPPSVQSVQSNPSAFSSAGPPQTVANGQNRPSPWRTPNGASSYCTSPFGSASLPESTGAPPSGAVGSTPFGVMMQSDGLSSMLLAEPDSLFNDKAHLLNGAPSPRSEDPLGGLPGSAYAQYAEMNGTGAPARRGDAPENTAAAILKIKESMREEAKRFETSDSSSVMTPNSN